MTDIDAAIKQAFAPFGAGLVQQVTDRDRAIWSAACATCAKACEAEVPTPQRDQYLTHSTAVSQCAAACRALKGDAG